MTKTLPNYLKVHRGPDSPNPDRQNSLHATKFAPPSTTSTPSASVASDGANWHDESLAADPAEQFWSNFASITGWRPDRRTHRRGEPIDVLPTVGDVDMGSVLENAGNGTLIIDGGDTAPPQPHTIAPQQSFAPEQFGQPTDRIAGITKADAVRLAGSAARLTDQLADSTEALRRQSMEIASRASLIAGDESASRLADRIESLMSDGCAACGCDAAVLYLLDEDTQFLAARAVFGMHTSLLSKPPRPLRGSRGDLEAMVSGVVAVDDFAAATIDTYNAPGSFAAGICVVIKSADVPIGTLWLFADETKSFGKPDAAAARLVATSIALELSSASKCRDDSERKKTGMHLRDIAAWQQESMPVGAMLASNWRVDGMVESPADWATGWHVWDVLPDGTLMLAIAEAIDRSMTGAMNATVARAALAAHANYRHTPAQIVGRISDTLWQTSTGEQLLSLLYARVDPETGEGEVASAGKITAMIGNQYGYRPLVDGLGEPLNTHINARPVMRTFRMLSGETMLAYTPGMVETQSDQRLLGESIRRSMRTGDQNPLAAIRRDLAAKPLGGERGAMSLLRI